MTNVDEAIGYFGQLHPHSATNISNSSPTSLSSIQNLEIIYEVAQWSIMRSRSIMNWICNILFSNSKIEKVVFSQNLEYIK